jgi:peptidoglycan hydrolase CwlO-like protein
MHPFLKRVIGVTLIIAAILGLLFSVAGIAAVWVIEPRIESSLNHALVIGGSVLDTSAEALTIADRTLSTTISSMDSLKGAVESASKTFDQISPLADTLSKLSKDTLPGTLKAAQTSLNSAAESAKVIDNVLGALNSIPFMPKDLYNPKVPLHESLGNVANSLNDYLGSLETTQKSLAEATGSLAGIQAQLDGMATQIGNIGTSMKDAQGVVQKYQALIKITQERVNWLKSHLETILIVLAAITTLILLWAMVVQLALFVQGWTLLKDRSLVTAGSQMVPATPLPVSGNKPVVEGNQANGNSPENAEPKAKDNSTE